MVITIYEKNNNGQTLFTMAQAVVKDLNLPAKIELLEGKADDPALPALALDNNLIVEAEKISGAELLARIQLVIGAAGSCACEGSCCSSGGACGCRN